MIIVQRPDPRLKQPCREVIESDHADLPSFIEQMVDDMYTNEGVGLAAPQIGRNIRLIVLDPTAGDNKRALRVMINPVVLQSSPEVEIRLEGCLSLPGEIFNVKRSVAARVRYLNSRFNIVEIDLFDMEARIFLHEYDHLMGILISDHGSKRA